MRRAFLIVTLQKKSGMLDCKGEMIMGLFKKEALLNLVLPLIVVIVGIFIVFIIMLLKSC